MNVHTHRRVPQKHRGYVFFVGLLLLLLGSAAISAPIIATITSIEVFGWLLIFAGLSQLIFTFFYHESNTFSMHALISILTILMGVLTIIHPEITADTITLLLAAFFLAIGFVRIYSALILRFKEWGWTFVGGILSTLLGILILLHWPSSELWTLGLFIGIELIFTGWSFIFVMIVLKRVV